MSSWSSLFANLLLVQLSLGCSGEPRNETVFWGSGGTTAGVGGAHNGNGAAGSLGGAGGASGSFELVFEDEFDSLDTTRWETATHTFQENAAQFDEEMVSVVDGMLELRLEKAETVSSEGKLYRGGELRTREFFGYGRFEARIQFARGSGLISSFFTFYDHYSSPDLEENWNEIDIEYVGRNPNQLQYNVIHWNDQGQRRTHEHEVSFDFDPTSTFHDYAIEWLPSMVNFYVDGELVHSQTDQIAEHLTLDSRLMMNLWPVVPSLASWAGKLDETALPATAKYDWVRVYRYVGQ